MFCGGHDRARGFSLSWDIDNNLREPWYRLDLQLTNRKKESAARLQWRCARMICFSPTVKWVINPTQPHNQISRRKRRPNAAVM
jgi:hypothetical protein